MDCFLSASWSGYKRRDCRNFRTAFPVVADQSTGLLSASRGIRLSWLEGDRRLAITSRGSGPFEQ
jgi:hypothetical protein